MRNEVMKRDELTSVSMIFESMGKIHIFIKTIFEAVDQPHKKVINKIFLNSTQSRDI